MSDSTVVRSLKYRKYLHIVVPLFLASVIAFLDRVNVAYAALTMNKDMGFTAQVFGMGAGIFFLGYILFEVPGALIAEKWSPRVWVARIMISWGIVCGLMAFMTTELEFYIYRFLLGAAEASFYPVVYAVIMPRWFNSTERPQAISIMLTSLLVAAIIGSPLAGWLLGVPLFGLKGWQVLFFVEAIPAVLFGIILLYWLSDWPKDAKWLTQEEKQMLTEQYEQEIAAKNSAKKYTVWQAFHDKEVLKLCLIYFMWITGFWGFNFWMPTVLKAVSGWSNAAIGWIIVIPMTITLIAFILVGNSSSRTGEKRWHVAIPMFIGAVGMGLGPFVSDPFISLVLVCISAIGVYVGMGVWWTYPTSFLSGPAAAGAVGLINSVGNTGGWVGPYLTGFIKDLTGSFQWAYLYLAFSLMVAGLLILTLRKNLPTSQANKPL
ncbi:MFS transporter [Sporomusaceae bacterium FL31]|nr:MFS transporter [Sporomusaceae bacterium FL31]GCE34631.1 MFS transporter [Sporomusaceae bacterium]